ncbi:MAG: hypothetical protein Q8L52_01690, partial [bacterium]|nr:hypothetical protein [bacterium]
DDVMKIIEDNAELLDSTIIYDRDFCFDYFGFKTLEKSYLLRVDSKIVERPQPGNSGEVDHLIPG